MKILALFLLSTISSLYLQASELKPLMLKQGELIYHKSFDEDQEKIEEFPSTNKRWSSKNGILTGLAPSAEYLEANPKSHGGAKPNIFFKFSELEKPYPNVCAYIKVKFGVDANDETPTPKLGFAGKSTVLWFENKKARIGTIKYTFGKIEDFEFKADQWYNILMETHGDETIFQIENGPTFYGKHEVVELKDNGPNTYCLIIAGTEHGSIMIDEIKVWQADEKLEAWKQAKATLTEGYVVTEIDRKKKKKKKS